MGEIRNPTLKITLLLLAALDSWSFDWLQNRLSYSLHHSHCWHRNTFLFCLQLIFVLSEKTFVCLCMCAHTVLVKKVSSYRFSSFQSLKSRQSIRAHSLYTLALYVYMVNNLVVIVVGVSFWSRKFNFITKNIYQVSIIQF